MIQYMGAKMRSRSHFHDQNLGVCKLFFYILYFMHMNAV